MKKRLTYNKAIESNKVIKERIKLCISLIAQFKVFWVGDIMPYERRSVLCMSSEQIQENPGPFENHSIGLLSKQQNFVDYKDYGKLSVERMKKQISSSMQEVFLKQRRDFLHFYGWI